PPTGGETSARTGSRCPRWRRGALAPSRRTDELRGGLLDRRPRGALVELPPGLPHELPVDVVVEDVVAEAQLEVQRLLARLRGEVALLTAHHLRHQVRDVELEVGGQDVVLLLAVLEEPRLVHRALAPPPVGP